MSGNPARASPAAATRPRAPPYNTCAPRNGLLSINADLGTNPSGEISRHLATEGDSRPEQLNRRVSRFDFGAAYQPSLACGELRLASPRITQARDAGLTEPAARVSRDEASAP
jgi:hypothetical protein